MINDKCDWDGLPAGFVGFVICHFREIADFAQRPVTHNQGSSLRGQKGINSAFTALLQWNKVFREPIEQMPRALHMRFMAVFIAAAVIAGWSQDWPQWRGSRRDGMLAEYSLPNTWPERLIQRWQLRENVVQQLTVAVLSPGRSR